MQQVKQAIELYLKVAVKPFLRHHETFYKKLNEELTKVLDKNEKLVPRWFTANAVTYGRTLLLLPCLYLWARDHALAPAALTLLNDFGDFFDGVLARWWAKRKAGAKALEPEVEYDSATKTLSVPSSRRQRIREQYGQYIDAILDKVYVVPVWVFALAKTVEKKGGSSVYLRAAKLALLWSLIALETGSAFVRTREYLSRSGAVLSQAQSAELASKVAGFSRSSAVKSDGVGKAKQTLEMVGTALYMVPVLRPLGLATLFLALPLAVESVARKVTARKVFLNCDWEDLTASRLRLLQNARACGSTLVLGCMEVADDDSAAAMELGAYESMPAGGEGIAGANKQVCATALRRARRLSAIHCVDVILVGTPQRPSSSWLRERGIDLQVHSDEQLPAPHKSVVDDSMNLRL